jgi:hypothetical protein
MKAMYSCYTNFDKIEFLHALKARCENAFCSTSIASSFRKTAIISFNLAIVLDLFPSKPLVAQEHEVPEDAADNMFSPSTPSSAQAWTHYADNHRNRAMLSPVWKHLFPFLKGAVAIATL